MTLLSGQLKTNSLDHLEACLDETVVLGYLDRQLGAQDRHQVEAHIGRCSTCRELLGMAALDPDIVSHDPSLKTAAGPETQYSQTLFPNDRVDHFRIIELLARGGMGEVFLAEDTRLQRRVALKIISSKLFKSHQAKQRMLLEARTTAQFNHPNIVTIHHVGEYGDSPYLALEYLEGQTLRQLLNTSLVARIEAFRIGLAVAKALREAHKHGVLHRDLKPHNIVICQNNKLRVVDFGLAKLGDGITADESRLMSPGNSHGSGTPGYMSPEQWRNETLSGAVDIWALGLILYELLSGKRPFRETTLQAYGDSICSPQVVPPLPVTDLPASIVDLVARCLDKRADNRPSARQVEEALEQLLNDEMIWLTEQLETSSQQWQQHNLDSKLLWRDGELARAQRILAHSPLPLSARTTRFVSASINLQQKRDRQRKNRLIFLLVLAIVSACLAGVFAHTARQQSQEAKRQRNIALQESAEALVEGARVSLQTKSYVQARAKVRRGLEIADSAPARLLWWQLQQDPVVWSQNLQTGIFDVALSTDGTTVAAAGQDRTVYLLDVDSLKTRRLRGHMDQVTKVAFSSQGKLLASASWSGEIRVWSLDSGKSQVLRGHDKRLLGLFFGSAAKQLFSVQDGGEVRVWDLQDTAPKARWHDQQLSAIAVTRDKRLVACYEHDHQLRIRKLPAGEILQTIPLTGENRISSLAFKDDSTQLAAGTSVGLIRLWDFEQSQWVSVLRGHTAAVKNLVFVKDGLVSTGQDKSIRLWPATPSQGPQVLATNNAAVWGLAQNQGHVVTASLEGQVALWDMARVRPPTAQHAHVDGVSSVAFQADGRLLASGSYDRKILLWDVVSGQVVRSLKGHRGTIKSLDHNPRLNMWLSASSDSTVRTWQVDHGYTQSILGEHKKGVYSAAFSSSGEVLASGSADQMILLWQHQNSEPLARLSGHSGNVFSVAFGPDDRVLVSAGADRTIRLWDVASRAQQQVVLGHGGTVSSVVFDSSGQRVASGCYDGGVRIFDRTTGQLKLVGQHQGRVYSVAFSPDGRQLVSSGADGRVVIWDLERPHHRQIARLTAEVNQVRFSPDGQHLAAACDDGTVRIWRQSDARPLWHAPLLLAKPWRLATANGWRGETPATPADTEQAWQKRMLVDTHRASTADGPGTLCLLGSTGQVELWSMPEDTRFFTTQKAKATQVKAIGSGCAVLAEGTVWFYEQSGKSHRLQQGVLQIESVDGQILLTRSATEVTEFSAQAIRLRSLPVTPGVTAMGRIDNRLIVGRDSGTIEFLEGEVGGSFAFETTPSNPVIALIQGPQQTLLAGYNNGFFGIWSSTRGALLFSAQLHGPVIHLKVSDKNIAAASELGSLMSRVDVFSPSYCELLFQVWESSKVVWREGLVVDELPPPQHACAERRSRP